MAEETGKTHLDLAREGFDKMNPEQQALFKEILPDVRKHNAAVDRAEEEWNVINNARRDSTDLSPLFDGNFRDTAVRAWYLDEEAAKSFDAHLQGKAQAVASATSSALAEANPYQQMADSVKPAAAAATPEPIQVHILQPAAPAAEVKDVLTADEKKWRDAFKPEELEKLETKYKDMGSFTKSLGRNKAAIPIALGAGTLLAFLIPNQEVTNEDGTKSTEMGTGKKLTVGAGVIATAGTAIVGGMHANAVKAGDLLEKIAKAGARAV